MQRIMTGIVLLGVGSFVVIQGGLWFFLWLLLVGILAFYEVYLITELKSKLVLLLNSLLYSTLLFICAAFKVFPFAQLYYYLLLDLVGVVVLSVFYGLILFELVRQKLIFKGNKLFTWLKYFLYIFIGFSSVMSIRIMTNGLYIVGFLFLSIWACDIFALYGGKRFGKHKLSSISPNKTVEGTLVGVSSAMLIIFVICIFNSLSFIYVILAGIVAFFGQLGDLYESLIKRSYKVKDSSNLLPGHGGILDRADSTLFVFPVVYLLLTLLKIMS